MAKIKGMTIEQDNALHAACKNLDDLMRTLNNDHTDTLEARNEAEGAWDDFFSLCDAYDTDRMDAYWKYTFAA